MLLVPATKLYVQRLLGFILIPGPLGLSSVTVLTHSTYMILLLDDYT
jgi:hypothetical protein